MATLSERAFTQRVAEGLSADLVVLGETPESARVRAGRCGAQAIAPYRQLADSRA
jgi:hypothetical protein